MTPATVRMVLAALPAALEARISSTLDEAAATVAADVRSRLEQSASPAGLGHAVTAGRDPESGAAIITIDEPWAAEMEYGSVGTPARPVLRPAVDGAETDLREKLATDLKTACRAAVDEP